MRISDTDRRDHLLTICELEESMSVFGGVDKMDISNWILGLEDMAELCNWTNVQKIIYARRLLRGSASIFVSYEK